MERLKQKVIASLQQAAGGTFSGGGGGGGEHAAAPTSPQQSSNPETNAAPAVAAAAAAAAAAASGGAVQLPEAALSTSWLAAADATAHLTEKEREILLCVFKKEEQFKRDLIKEWSSLRAQQQEPGAGDGHCGGVPAAGAGAATSGRQPISRQQSLSAMSSAAAATSSTAAQRATCAAHAHQPPTRFSPASSSGASSAASRPNSSSAGRPQASAGGPAPASGAGSSCASSAPSGNSTPGAAHVGLCRICRKLIGPTEPCHLCSNCQQIICDDCASYSASDQHWMCSSCRRRAMNPAIPAEALKELGLNQNSSALRRMTLRLNQNELKLAINKSSSESNSSSSNSSSGCSSIQPASSIQQRLRHMAPTGNAATAAATATTSTTASQLPGGALGSVAPDPGEPAGKLASGRQLAAAASVSSDKTSQSTVASKQQNKRPVASLPLDSLPSDLSRPKAQQSRSGGQPAAAAPTQPGAMPKIRPQLGTTTSDLAGGSGAALVQFSAAPLIDGGAAQVDSRASGRASYEPAGAQHKLVAQKTMSQPSASGTPTPGVSATPSHQQQAPPTGRAPGGASPGHRRSSIRRGPSATATATAAAAAAPGTTGVPRQLHQQQELARRASAVAMGQAAAGSSLGAASQQRKQSSAAALAQESTSAGPGRYVFDSSQRNSIVAMHQHLIKQRFAQQQPQTLITGPDSRRNSFQQAADYCELGAAADGSAHANNTLIPVPPEQMHLRRLSDQSNLVRRSSIIVDTLTSDNGLAIARNRSHSNTDCSGYIYQAALMQQQQQQQQQQLSSIITSYAHKNRHSSEDLHSDSSSDIADCAADDAPRATQMAPYEQLGPYAAPSDTYQQQQHQRQVFYSQQHQAAGANGQQQQAPGAGQFRMQHQTSVGSSSIQIPSVSVSEFNVAQQQQRRNSNAALSSSVSNGSHQQQQQQQQQQVIYSPDQISAIGEINVAIEQVIQQQKQREQQQQLMPSQVANGGARRGSSGRILPKIPGEIQSRSLLDLPLQPAGGHAGDPGAGPASGGAGGPGRASGDGQMLDLPSPTIRRASAPEGQNIKIVVDDIDSHGCYNACNLIKPHNHHLYLQQHQHHPHYLNNCNTNNNNSTSTNNHGNHYNHLNYIHQKALLAGAKGGQVGELLERLVLYRDDSLDPGGNSVSRGFGLQVMGGKLGADGELSAQVAWVLAQGPADKSGLGPGDQLIEWDGKCLLGLSYEQVAEVIESSGNFAELLVKPVQRLGQQPGANYIRSQRRMSQQTETDLRRMQEQQQLQQFQQQQQQQQSLAAPNGGLIIPNWSGQQHRRLSGSQLQAMGHTAEIHQQMHRLGGSGRKLPQIPGAATDNQYPLHQVSSYGGQAQAGEQMPLGPGARHASTGQLENSGLFHQHQQQFGGYQSATNEQQIKLFPSNLGLRMQHQLDGSYPAVSSQHLSASGVSAQPMGDSQQSRSASELHANVNYHHQHQQQQAQLRNQITAAGSTLTLNASLWAQPGAMASQQAVSENMLNYGDQAKPMQQQQYYNGHMAATNGRGRHHLILQQQQQQPPMHDEICGLIGLQLNVDTRAELLEISILSAVNVNRNTSLDYCARLKILPENGRFKACTTQPSADLNWKETFIFQNFPTHQAHKMALEIGIWAHDEAPRLAAHIAQPICETLIPIQSARERNIDFWPLRPAPSSPQTRRKSLNDLFGPNYQIAQNQDLWSQAEYAHNQSVATFRQTAGSQRQQAAAAAATTTPTAKRQASQAPIRQQSQQQQQQPITTQAYGGQNTFASSTTSQRASPNDSPQRRPSYGQLMQHYAGRERSSSNRNLPTENSNKLLQVQPRRASDEVAASSSHRMVARMSPAPSRRSISVINVGGGGDRSSQSRLGSQSNIMKAHLRRDSTVGSGGGGGLQQQQQQQMVTGSASPPSKFGTPTGAGRRVSMASGCRSQKNSQSDATDHESPLGGKAHKRSRESSLATDLHASSQPPTPPTGTPIGQQSRQQTRAKQARKKGLQQQQPNSTSAIGGSTHPSCSSNSGSRRGSTESPAGQLHRRGSFAMQTLHKLKRTMSLNKGNTSQSDASNQESRRSSSSSGTSGNQLVAEDLAVSRLTEKKDSVGRLKMSFIMTKGQFEIDVISAQGLKFDHSSATGLYVKMYLKGRSKSHKRKTRVVQPWESPVFKQTIKYDGPLIDNKLLEVRVWLRQTGFRAKQPIGFTEIRLAELSLDQLQTSWYNLRPMDSVCSSSLED